MSCKPTKQILKAADFLVRISTKKEPTWLPRASRICQTLSSLQACFPLYAKFKDATDPGDLKKPHVFMNDDAKTKLAEFSLCAAYQLRKPEVELAGSDNEKLLELIEDTAKNTVEPFLTDVRSFIADYDAEIHKALEETTVYKTIDPRLFWHHNFLLADPERYAEYLNAYDEAYVEKGEEFMASAAESQISDKAQPVYDKWMEISGMPVKGQIQNALIDYGFIFGQRAYEPPVKSIPKEASFE